jgi:hypothetical protein
MAQYDSAERLFKIPYETLHEIAAAIELDGRLVFIHSTGRAGSTLLSKAFGEIGTVTSLSEPDVYQQLAVLRFAAEQDQETRDLLVSATKLFFKPTFAGGSLLNVIKFRSTSIEVADLLSGAFPGASNIFLYRDIVSYTRSATRAFGFGDLPADVRSMITLSVSRAMPLLVEELKLREPDLAGAEITTFMWLSAMHGYARLLKEGVDMLAVRYEELVEDPSRVLRSVLDHVGVPGQDVQAALRAFERDSQAGSPLSREAAAQRSEEITDSTWDSVRDLIRRYPVPASDIPKECLVVP